jgi:hypothetical protein
MHFGLENLEDLPPLEEFEELLGDLGAVPPPQTSVSTLEKECDVEAVPRPQPSAAFPAAVDGRGDSGEEQ